MPRTSSSGPIRLTPVARSSRTELEISRAHNSYVAAQLKEQKRTAPKGAR